MTNNPTPTTNATMKEKEEVLRNEARANTYAGRAQAELDLENVGRHARSIDITGKWDGPNRHPFLPASSPWSVDHDPVPPEEPLGYDINQVPIVGEPHEIQALGDAASSVALGDVTTESTLGSASPQPVALPVAGAKQQTPVSNNPSRTGGAEAPSEVSCLSPDVEPPAIPPNPKRREL
jgi:hypothetical protein